MIRLLASVALIAAMVLTMDRVLASSLGAMLLDSGDRFLSIYKPGPAADVLVLGNSRADNHFSAGHIREATCWDSVNLGMGGAPTVISDLLFQDYVERHGAPKLLLLEPTGVVDPPSDLADLPLLSYYSERVDGHLRVTDHSMWAGNKAFHLLTFNNNQTLRMGVDMLRGADGDRLLEGSVSEALRREIEALPEERMVGHEPNWRALDRIIETARAHDTAVAVVLTPLYPGYIRKVVNFEPFFDELKARLPKDVAVIDARRAVREEHLFRDALHVNADGVKDMFRQIGGDLRPLGGCESDAIAQARPEAPVVPTGAVRPKTAQQTPAQPVDPALVQPAILYQPVEGVRR